MKKAPFITLEGGDRSGKTSVARFLQERLEAKGVAHRLVREPGGTFLGEKLRSLLLEESLQIGKQAELALFLGARSQLIEEIIAPSLAAGVLVLADRFHDSSIAYQGAGRGLGEEFVERLGSLFWGDFSPDLTLFFDIDPEEAQKRGFFTQDRIESEELSFHQIIRASYLRLAKKHARIRTIDAQLPLIEVQKTAWNLVEAHL
ncbi:MAG: dTMP kinase [Chlamydiota bacterium]